jgi:hypothetical protein
MSLAIAAILSLVVAGALSPVWGDPQVDPQKRQGAPPQPIQPEPKTPTDQPAQAGGMDDMNNMDYATRMMQVDSSMQRVHILFEKSQTLSKSFGKLAVAHHGADKSEILMMQRMSDSMGTMAGELNTTLQQYKKMLGDETVSESGKMKTEVQSLKGYMDSIAGHVEEALQTLQKLQAQLGQG